jgi:glycosyltransferase involved in cell wall biosynthesis
MPEVSVIVPTYNYAHFIGDCLDSIFSQTYKDFEVIVVDDGSTDDTAQVLKKYRGEIHYIHQENRGLPAARNTGIRAAQGEYLAFLDSDDLWLPDKLDEQIRVLRNDADMGIIFSDASAFDEKGVIRESILKEENTCTGFCFQRLFMGNYLVMPTVMIRTRCLEKGGLFDESLTAVEDYDLWLRISIYYKIGFVAKVLAKYRVHPSNMSRDFFRLMENEIKVIQKIIEQYPGPVQKLGGRVSVRVCSLFNQYGLEWIEKGNAHQAKKSFLRAVKARPGQLRSYYYLLATMAGKRGFERLREFKRSWLRLNL